MLNFEEEIKIEEQRLDSLEQTLGKGLYQPFTTNNSGSRKILFETQLEHSMPLLHPEVPIIQTGYESRFGEYSSSVIKTDTEYEVMAKIVKFSSSPKSNYFLIVKNVRTNQLDVIERTGYKHKTESYGYLYNNKTMDMLDVGYTIPKGTVLRTSLAFDDYGNRCDGVNLNTAYLATDKTMEDGIVISESAALKLSSPLLKNVSILINDNDIPLNLYGDDEIYKCMPDIGEEVKNGILIALRRENTDNSLYTQSCEMLKKVFMSDDKYPVDGEVVDITINSNNPADLERKHCNSQIYYYYKEKMRYLSELVDALDDLAAQGYKDWTYDLSRLYTTSVNELLETEHIKDNKVYSGTLINIILLERNIPKVGDKITNRFGGKGVIACKLPDEQMPMLSNGKRFEIIFNQATCVNRLNDGQLKETSLTHIASRILDYINTGILDTNESLEMILKYVSMMAPDQAADMYNYISHMNDEEKDMFLQSILDDDYIILSLRPASDGLSLDKLADIYREFPFATQYEVLSPIADSNGNIRYVKGRRPVVCGKMYIYRLKQYAEEKFSVTSSSSVNIRNENTRSKASKNFRDLYTNTPIKFGDMEITDMFHIGAEQVISALMIHSVSPQARRLVEKMLTGDPYNIDIKLDSNSTNRSAEIVNIYLKSMGLRLEFKKIKKHIQKGIFYKGITYHDQDEGLDRIHYMHPEEKGKINLDRRMKDSIEAAKRGILYKGIIYNKKEKENK